MRDVTGEVTELLQQLIRNACVNDGTSGSGHESRNAGVLRDYLDASGLDLETFEPISGRASVVARLEGNDPNAPSLLLMGHTDVVPVTEENWRHDPFGGELIDGEVWGRGAVDMLNLTASMAVAARHLADHGFRPRGDLIYLGVADEEALGLHGAAWLTENAADSVAADYVITESGGIRIPTPGGVKLPVVVAEKGSHWCTLRVSGTAGHASAPLRTDNALVTAAEVIRRIATYRAPTRLHDTWRRFVEGMEFPAAMRGPLLQEEGFVEMCEGLPMIGLAQQAHACTHTTFAPTVVRGGSKTNVIPDRVDLELDIRTLPGDRTAEVEAMLAEAVGDLWAKVEILRSHDDPATESPIDTPLMDVLQRVSGALVPGAQVVPFMTVGATDARFFRRKGVTAYGFGLFSDRLDFEQYGAMFHGDNERVDQESLRLSTEMFAATAEAFLGS